MSKVQPRKLVVRGTIFAAASQEGINIWSCACSAMLVQLFQPATAAPMGDVPEGSWRGVYGVTGILGAMTCHIHPYNTSTHHYSYRGSLHATDSGRIQEGTSRKTRDENTRQHNSRDVVSAPAQFVKQKYNRDVRENTRTSAISRNNSCNKRKKRKGGRTGSEVRRLDQTVVCDTTYFRREISRSSSGIFRGDQPPVQARESARFFEQPIRSRVRCTRMREKPTN